MAGDTCVLTIFHATAYTVEPAPPEPGGSKDLLCLPHLSGSRSDYDPWQTGVNFDKERVGYIREQDPLI